MQFHFNIQKKKNIFLQNFKENHKLIYLANALNICFWNILA